MNNKYLFAIVMSLIFMSSLGALAKQTKIDSMLLQLRPGYNPEGLTYQKEVHVVTNGRKVQGKFLLTDSSAVDANDTYFKLHKLEAGETLEVDATFQNPDGTDVINCSRSWTAVAENSIACGPIEVYYQAYNDTCVLVCD